MRNTRRLAIASYLPIACYSAFVAWAEPQPNARWGASATNTTIPVPSVVIYVGQILIDDNIKEKIYHGQPKTNESPIISNRDDMIGKLAVRTLLPGHPVRKDDLRSAYSVFQGRVASIMFENRGLSISGYGMPLQSGSVGESVDIRNPQTGIIVRGKVLFNNTVDLSHGQ